MIRSFEDLFGEAVAEWPPILRLKVQRPGQDRFILVGLTELCDRTGPARVGRRDEVLFVILHWAITSAIHAASKGWPDHIFRIAMADLRPDQVRPKFEDDLRSALQLDAWTPADHATIRAYFEGV